MKTYKLIPRKVMPIAIGENGLFIVNDKGWTIETVNSFGLDLEEIKPVKAYCYQAHNGALVWYDLDYINLKRRPEFDKEST